MATLYFALDATNTAADFNASGTFKDASSNAATVPGNNDTILFDSRGAGKITSNGGAATGLKLIFDPSMPSTAELGTSAAYLAVSATAITMLGPSSGSTNLSGSPRIKVNVGASALVANIGFTSTSSSDSNIPPVQIIGTNLAVTVSSGSVAIAPRPGETATGTVTTISPPTGGTTPFVLVGQGGQISSITSDAGSVVSFSNSATAVATTLIYGGTYEVRGTVAHTSLTTGAKGTAVYSGGGTITTLKNAGTFDGSHNINSSVTITNATVYANSTLNIDNGISGAFIFTNPVLMDGCGLGDFKVITAPGGHFQTT